ncbi:uncharacterized protein At1g15400-like [Lycium barbarum]|uniref:uncharacterized protein At1g15400-like n=1 Tax=Lycium barbarum TaxID=112863 RepID=UPI00293EC83C|nr:uncharacterized protein At1g15400-like [Lycium barbarum]
MAGLQRSAVSFRRQGSSGLIWDDKYLSGQLVKRKEETNKELEWQPKKDMLLVKASSRAVGSTERSRSNGGAVEPPSPKVSACGLCSAIGKKDKSRH